MRKMRGIATIEFAIVASVLMVLLFACIEFGRATYSFASLQEGTRRAARLAAVCPVNDAKIVAAVNFMNVYGFTNANVGVDYLSSTGASLGAAPALVNIRYVRVSIVGFSLPLAIPLASTTLTSPAFTVTLPAESLGISDTGASTAC